MDLIVRNAGIAGRGSAPVDIGIEGGRVVALEPMLTAEGQEIDVGGRFVSAGLVETHIHLDKTCIIDRCTVREETPKEAVEQTALAKRSFTEICAFPQEGLLNNSGTETLLAESLRRGARVLDAVPYTDSDPRGQIDHVFALARDRDVDIDMHLDLGDSPEGMDIDYVCDLTERYRYGGGE